MTRWVMDLNLQLRPNQDAIKAAISSYYTHKWMCVLSAVVVGHDVIFKLACQDKRTVVWEKKKKAFLDYLLKIFLKD